MADATGGSAMQKLFGKFAAGSGTTNPTPAGNPGAAPNPDPNAKNHGTNAGNNGTVPGQQGTGQKTGESNQLEMAGKGTKDSGESSPLDQFNGLWDTPAVDPKKTANPNDAFNLDPAKLKETAGKLNYSQLIPPEMMQKALAGDAAVFGKILNTVAQAGFAHSAMATNQQMKNVAKQVRDEIMSSLPAEFKKYALGDTNAADNPNFSHPAVAPVVKAIQGQFALKYPDASTSELRKMATDYLTNLTGSVQDTNADDGKGSGKSKGSHDSQQDMDWMTHFGLSEE